MNKTIRGKLQLAYLAGIIDGEGCLGISKNTTKKQRQKNPKYQSEVCIINTDTRLMNWLKENFGGLVNERKIYGPNDKISYRWRIKESQHQIILKAIIPHLVIKTEQAKLIIKFLTNKTQNNLDGREVSQKEIIRREYYYQEIKKLNTRGNTRRD